MNKYLEKIAIFGFSKEEKQRKAGLNYYLEGHNSVLTHVNNEIQKVNEKWKGIKINKDNVDNYVEDFKSNIHHNHPGIKAAFHPIYEKHYKKLKELDLPINNEEEELKGLVAGFHFGYDDYAAGMKAGHY
jgi:hypothetical protein